MYSKNFEGEYETVGEGRLRRRKRKLRCSTAVSIRDREGPVTQGGHWTW